MPWSSSQLIEVSTVVCTVASFCHGTYLVRNAFVHANSKGGPVKPASMPTRLSTIIPALQGFLFITFPVVYTVTLVYCGMQQPAWMRAIALPNVLCGVTLEGAQKNTIRLGAYVVGMYMQRSSEQVFEHLDDQYHAIGRREKGRVIQTGPYGWVRHPMYSVTILQSALSAFMFWSYVPLLISLANILLLVVKIPIEEKAILRDEATREEYRAYMKKVPARLIPNIF